MNSGFSFMRESDIQHKRKQVLSLQTGCISCIVEHLDEYSTEHLSLLPTKFRRQLLTSLPPLDILKLEGTSVVSGLDMNEVWHVIAEHYAEADDTSVLPRTFNSRNLYKTIKDDWRSIFLTRTLYIMLHTFNPSFVATKVAHRVSCDDRVCICWGLGMDPLHHDIFWRLIALPPRSYILFENISNFVVIKYYQEFKLFVPKRHAGYLVGTSILKLLTTLLKESHFSPKVIIFNCSFLHYSEFCQSLIIDTEGNKSPSLLYSLFADMLSEVECLEIFWNYMKSDFDLDASLHTLTSVLEAIFKNPSPKLTSLCVSTDYCPRLHECLPSIAPFFSAHHYTEASKNRVLPINMAYAGLRNLHIFAVVIKCKRDISSIILNQSSLEGIEIRHGESFCRAPDSDHLLASISQCQLQFFVFKGFWNCNFTDDFEKIFHQFLNNNHDFEISASVGRHKVIIPVRSSLETSSDSKTFICDCLIKSESGIIFSWLRNAHITKPLKLVKSDDRIDFNYQDALKHFLSSCEAFKWKQSFDSSLLSAFFTKIKCPNLQKVTLSVMSATRLLDLLPALFASSPQLRELSLSLSDDFSCQRKREDMFECLVSCPHPEQLTVDMRDDELLTQEDIEKLLQVWRKMGQGRKLKALLLKHGLQPLVAEMISQNL